MKDSEQLIKDLEAMPKEKEDEIASMLITWSIRRVQNAEKRLLQAENSLRCIVQMVREERELETPAQRVRRETKKLFHVER